jgi:hypothetical protein
MNFPFKGYAEIELIDSDGGLKNDEKTFPEKGRIIALNPEWKDESVKKGDVIFFRPHGYFELTEHEDAVRRVVRISEEFILYVIRPLAKK